MKMTARTTAALLTFALLAGCGGLSQSRINPFNWFKKRDVVYADFVIEKPVDPRPLIEMIVEMKVEKLPTGALVRATGRAATQGYWFAELVVNEVDDKGNLVIDFHAIPAQEGAAISTPRSREITAAVSLRGDTLASAKRITVRGAQNEKSARP